MPDKGVVFTTGEARRIQSTVEAHERVARRTLPPIKKPRASIGRGSGVAGTNGSNLTDCGCGNRISQLLGIDSDCSAVATEYRTARQYTFTLPSLPQPGADSLDGETIVLTHSDTGGEECIWREEESFSHELTCDDAGTPRTRDGEFRLTLIARTLSGETLHPQALVKLYLDTADAGAEDCLYSALAHCQSFDPLKGGLFEWQPGNCLQLAGCFCVSAVALFSGTPWPGTTCMATECSVAFSLLVEDVVSGDGYTELEKFNQSWPLFSAAEGAESPIRAHTDEGISRSGTSWGFNDPDEFGGLVLTNAGSCRALSGAVIVDNSGDLGIGAIIAELDNDSMEVTFAYRSTAISRVFAVYAGDVGCSGGVLTRTLENYGTWPATITVYAGGVNSFIDSNGDGIPEYQPCTGDADDDGCGNWEWVDCSGGAACDGSGNLVPDDCVSCCICTPDGSSFTLSCEANCGVWIPLDDADETSTEPDRDGDYDGEVAAGVCIEE